MKGSIIPAYKPKGAAKGAAKATEELEDAPAPKGYGKSAASAAYGVPYGGLPYGVRTAAYGGASPYGAYGCGPAAAYGAAYGKAAGYGKAAAFGAAYGMAAKGMASKGASPYGMAAPAAPAVRAAPQKPAAAAKKPQQSVSNDTPDLLWCEVSEESRMATEEGMEELTAPVLYHSKGQSVFSSAAHIIGDLVDDVATEVVLKHDADWQEYPDIAEAVKAAGGEENCYCIAVCPSLGRWAVGAGGGWKPRENAAKLSLAVALVAPGGPLADKAPRVARNYSDFRMLLQKADLLDAAAITADAAAERATGRSAKDKEPEEAKPLEGPIWLTLSEESAITEGGFPAEGAGCIHQKQQEFFSYAHGILQDIVGDISEEVEMKHDAEWKLFPEVGHALEEAGVGQQCFCLATCPSKGKWGVGIANGWKGREVAAKLALAVAIASDDSEVMASLAGNYPDFPEYCGTDPGTVKKVTPPPAKKIKAATSAAKTTVAKPVKAAKEIANPLPRDVPLWVQLDAETAMPTVLEDLPTGAVAVGIDDVKSRPRLYPSVDKVIAELVGDPKADIQYYDDPDWKEFPEVAQGIKEHCDEEVCMMIAVCSIGNAWAVGLGNKKTNRTTAAKAALAAGLVLQRAESGDMVDLSEFPEFEEFVGEVQVSA